MSSPVKGETMWPALWQSTVSRWVGAIANCQVPLIKNAFITLFARYYGIDMRDAYEPDMTAYPHFNAFFTRALAPTARPIAEGGSTLVSPVDGVVSQVGRITDGTLLQAKGHTYTLSALLDESDPSTLAAFDAGHFATFYLSPRDYHRVHIPLAGALRETRYLPGTLFSVNARSVERVPHLFTRNERLVLYVETALGKMAIVMVGAMIVAGIETAWGGKIDASACSVQLYSENSHVFRKGDEMGRFYLGSTVIVVCPDSPGMAFSLTQGQSVRMGEAITPSHSLGASPTTGEIGAVSG